MKTTFELPDALMARVKRHAKRTGRPMRELVEEGLRLVLEAESRPTGYKLPDRRVGNPGDPNPLADMSWPEIRDLIYEGR